MTARDGWTPYGLEAIRIRHLRRRRLLTGILVFGLLAVWMLMFETTTSTQQEIFANGNKVGGGIKIDVPEEKREDKPVTVAISPGRVTRADTSQEAGGSTVERPGAPVITRAPPYNWVAYVILYGPFVLVGLALYLMGQRRRVNDEVNLGVYKGTMPLEMITHSARQHVLTRRYAHESVFGKRRQDYLPREMIRIERVPQEEDA